MPSGSKPGERRGGRKKGTPNKATAARKADLDSAISAAIQLLGPDEIDKLTPAELMLTAMRGLARAGMGQAAIAIAKEAAPYYNSKMAPKSDDGDVPDGGIRITGGLPNGD